MACRSNEELDRLVLKAKEVTKDGEVAQYIPELAKANRDDLSVAVYYPDGQCFSAGDINKKMTLQSISKVVTLALALMDLGEEVVFEKVGYEPTGDPFNSIIKLETAQSAKPLNPMINAGALAVTHLIKGKSVDERLERIMALVFKLVGHDKVTVSEKVAKSEFETADLNRSLCYYMKSDGVIDENVEELLDLYTKQCAIEMNSLDLARIGLVFAMDGIDPMSNEQIIPPDVARLCKTFMLTCGMYNASGEFAVRVGIPAKSGVSGGIMGSVSNRYGIGIFGPALDMKGNSIGGMKLLELMSEQYDLSIF